MCSIFLIVLSCCFSTNNNIAISAKAASVPKPNFSVNTGDGCVTLSWKAIDKADKYYVYCYLGNEQVTLQSTKNTSIKINKLKNDTEYKFLVRTVIDNEKSSYNNYDWIKATPSKNKISKLETPIVSASQSTSDLYSINVKWQKVANATSYTLYYKKYDDEKYIKATTTTGSFHTIKLDTLERGKYVIRVMAKYKNGDEKEISSTSKSKVITLKNVELSPYEFQVLMNELLPQVFGDVQITCQENTRKYMPFDVWIQVNSDTSLLGIYDYMSSINMTKKEKAEFIHKNVFIQHFIYTAAEEYMPNKKIMGGLYHGYYKYPNLKIDYRAIRAFTWVNYSNAEKALEYYDTKYTGKMKWYTVLDDYDFNLTQSSIEKAIEYINSL